VTDELDLIARAGAGDEEAFGRLVEMHQDRVYRAAVRLVGHEDALDISQEVFLKAYRELKRFKGRSALSTWLYRMAINLSLNYLRGQRREFDRRERFGPGVSDPPPNPERSMAESQLREHVWTAIDTLPERQRAAVTLHRFEGLSAPEVAEIMGLSVGAVESLLHRAKRTLMESFMRQGLSPPGSDRAGESEGSRNGGASNEDVAGSNS
jgi:RNA polymerase sigma-70 factor (ECF subfamily)